MARNVFRHDVWKKLQLFFPHVGQGDSVKFTIWSFWIAAPIILRGVYNNNVQYFFSHADFFVQFAVLQSLTAAQQSFFCLLYCWIRAKNFWPINSPFKFYNTRDFLWRNKKIQIWPNCLISYFVRGGSIYLDEPYMGKAATRADGQCVVYCKLVL